MKIIINHDNLVPDENWQFFYKVRAIIEDDNGNFMISHEAGKHIFPGGSCEKGETNLEAIKREIKEEAGIELNDDEFIEILELEALYGKYFDFRTRLFVPRCTRTVYYYARCSSKIDTSKMQLSDDEKSQAFKIAFVNSDDLIQFLETDHSKAINGAIFDEENRIILRIIKKTLLHQQARKI